MILNKVFKFGWGLFWLYAGAITSVALGFNGYAIGLGALCGLITGHLTRETAKRMIGGYNDK